MNKTRSKTGKPTLFHHQGLLYRDADSSHPVRLVAPTSWRVKIVKETHEQGHFGPEKCSKVISRRWWWPSMTKEITRICKECVSC